MGARPSGFRKSGGFLNGVDGVIVDYRFTDEFDGKPFEPGRDPKTKKERFHTLYFVPEVKVDGADETVTTHLFAGGADDFEVSEDGHVLTPVEEGRELSAGTAFAKLISSLCEAGFPETALPEDVIDFSSILQTRCHFVQRTNAEDTKRLGKRKDKKTGKEYDRQDLVIDQVYSLPHAGVTAAPAVTKKAAAPVKAGKVAAASKADVSELASGTLRDILGDVGGSIQKPKLSMKVLTKLMKHTQREDVRKWLASDTNISAVDGVLYDKDSGEIALAPADE